MLKKGLEGLENEMSSATSAALERTKALAGNPLITAAVSAKDPAVLLNLLQPMIKVSGLDFVTVTDSAGLVILRTHDPSKAGDSVAMQANVASALKGTAAAFVEQGTEIKLSARAGVPVKDAEGNIIGVLTAGYRLDKPDMVDRVKKMYGSECTIFLGDTRLMTTIEQDGKRVVGTTLDKSISQLVLVEGKTYNGRTAILGNPYEAAYMPLLGPSGKPIGVLFVGRPLKEANAAMAAAAWSMGLAGLAVLVLSVIAISFYVKRITGPLQYVVGELGQLSRGDFTVNLSPEMLGRKDEIGTLSKAMDGLTKNMRGLLRQVMTSTDQVAASSQELTASAEQSSQAANQVAIVIGEVAAGAAKQLVAVNETAAIVDNISDKIRQIADNAGGAAVTTAKSADDANDGGKAVEKAISQMRQIEGTVVRSAEVVAKLGERSAEIGIIVDTHCRNSWADQPVGAECRNRGRPRGRTGPGLRGSS